jgi:N-acetylglucosaminyldiphosphoundecaprenol N-acetyl-beta-D-mannosaminyltransferase
MPGLSNQSVAILGVPIDNVTMQQALQAIEQGVREKGFHQIATANVDFLINSIHDLELKEILSDCFLVLPDGMPLVWASRLMGTSLKERVSGADLVPKLIELAAHRGYSLFLLGSCEASSRGACRWIREHHPLARVVGRYSPAVADLEEMDNEDILLQIEAARPDILLVAFGSPKQEKWLAMHRHRLRVPVCIGIGGSLDLLSGRIPRAPQWMRDYGLEWFFRACQEPARLGWRYAKDASGLARYLSAQLAAIATQSQQASAAAIAEEMLDAATILHVDGKLTGKCVTELDHEARIALSEGHNLVLDLAEATYLGADALGELIHLGTAAKQHDRELWLTGLRPPLFRVIQATQLKTTFHTAPKVADALRRMTPAQMQLRIETGPNWASCRIGGRLIPMAREDADFVCRQVLDMVGQRELASAQEQDISTMQFMGF